MAGATNPNTVDRDRFANLATKLDRKTVKVALIVAPYYRDVADALEAGARAELDKAGCQIERVEVPGALELPQALQILAMSDGVNELAGAILIGCVIRGETSHYDIVCETANRFAMQVAIEAQLPLGNALLTVDTHDQAMARAAGSQGGKGADAARAVLSLIELDSKFSRFDDDYDEMSA
ncbi:MAG: 6,7-dimethyl-8-ribityllumazine synthase [Pseudomonadota bacterium]